MKKAYFTLLLFTISMAAFSHTSSKEYDFTIVFVGAFDNDIISLSINKKPLLNRYRLENTQPVNKGNLSLTQSGKELKIYYNGQETARTRIKVGFIVDVDVSINNRTKKLKVDLRKGKIILIDYRNNETETSGLKSIAIEQMHEPVILM